MSKADKKQIIEETTSNANYINWLKDFTQKKGSFFDNDWEYFPEQLNYQEKENVEKLGYLYEGIDKYAREKEICPNKCQAGYYYNIKSDDIGLSIGILFKDEITHFSKLIDLTNNNNYILFNDIINDNKELNKKYINSSLDALSNRIKHAYKNGVPLEDIINTLNKTISELIDEKENNSKLLLKK